MPLPSGTYPLGGPLIDTSGGFLTASPTLRDTGVLQLRNGKWYKVNAAGNGWIEAPHHAIGPTAPSDPFEGQLWYDTTNNVPKFYDGSSFVEVSGTGDGLDQAAVDARIQAAKGTATPTNTPGSASAGTSDNWSPQDHDHGVTADGGGLNQTQVDARVRAGVADWAETGNNDVFPLAKVDGAQAATQAPMRIRWSGTMAGLNAATFEAGTGSVGNTRDGVAAPQSGADSQFLGIWIGTAEGNIIDIEEGGTTVLGDLFANVAAGEPLTVSGTSGTVYRTAAAVTVNLWEAHLFRATLGAIHFGDVVDARIRDDVEHWALDGDTTRIPDAKLPSNLSEAFDEASLSGNNLTLNRRDDENPQVIDLSGIAGTSELPRWHHVSAESQFASLRTAGLDRLVADRDLTITATNTVTEVDGTQITSVLNGDVFIWNEQTTPNRWERFGNINADSRVQAAKGTATPTNTAGSPSAGTSDNWAPDDHDHGVTGGGGGGLNQAQVDARVQAGVADWAETGNDDAFPLAKINGAQEATVAEMRIRWSGTQAGLNATHFNTGQDGRGNTRDGTLAPFAPGMNEFLGIWIATAEANIADIEEGGSSVIGDLFPNIAAGEPLTVDGTAGTVYRTATAISTVLWSEHRFRATLSPIHFGDVVDARVRDDVVYWALDGDDARLPNTKLPSDLSEVFDGAELSGSNLTFNRRDDENPQTIDLSSIAGTPDGSTSIRSRVGHVDSVTIGTATTHQINLTEDPAAGNDYQIEITDDDSGMSIMTPMISGETIRAKVNLASAPTTYQNALISSILATRFTDAGTLSDNAVSRWNVLKSTNNRILLIVNVNGASRVNTIEVWKYPRALQGLKGDKGDKGDQGDPGTDGSGIVTFGAGAGEVSEIAEGNNTDVWPFSKLETGQTQASAEIRYGWDTATALNAGNVLTSMTDVETAVQEAPEGADRLWVVVRVDAASSVQDILLDRVKQNTSSGFFNQTPDSLTFNSMTYQRWFTRDLLADEVIEVEDSIIEVRLTTDNLDEHIDRRADAEITRRLTDDPVIQDITLADDAFKTENSAGQEVDLTWPNSVLNSALTIPSASSATPQQSGTTGSAGTSTDYSRSDHRHQGDGAGTGDVALDDLRALRDAGQILPYSANATLIGSSPTVDNRGNVNDGDLTTFATFNGSTKRGLTVDWGRVVRRPRIHVWASGASTISVHGVNANGHDAGAIATFSTTNGKTVWDMGERDIRGVFLNQGSGAASVNIFLIYAEDTRLTELVYDADNRRIHGTGITLPASATAEELAALGLRIDSLNLPTPDGTLYRFLRERAPVDTSFNLNLNWSWNVTNPAGNGSFNPAIPSGALGTMHRIELERFAGQISGVELQWRILIDVTEGAGDRTYEGVPFRWGNPGTGAVQQSTFRYLRRTPGAARNEYYSVDLMNYRPATTHQTAIFNIGDINLIREEHGVSDEWGTPWVWHVLNESHTSAPAVFQPWEMSQITHGDGVTDGASDTLGLDLEYQMLERLADGYGMRVTATTSITAITAAATHTLQGRASSADSWTTLATGSPSTNGIHNLSATLTKAQRTFTEFEVTITASANLTVSVDTQQILAKILAVTDDAIPATNPSDVLAPTQRAAKAYVDGLVPENIPDAPVNTASAAQYTLNVPATTGAPTWGAAADGSAPAGAIEGVKVYYWDGDTVALPDLDDASRPNVTQVGTDNTDRFVRLVFGSTASESYFSDFTVTRFTSAQAEASNIDQVGTEVVPAGHVYSLGPGTYGVEIAGRFQTSSDRHARQVGVLVFVESGTDDIEADAQPAQSGTGTADSDNPLLDTASSGATWLVKKQFFTVPVGSTAQFYSIFGTGGRLMKMSAVMTIIKYRS